MRKVSSSVDLHHHSPTATVQAEWLSAPDAPDVCVLAGSSRCRAAGQQVSAAALRIALASAGVEELRIVAERRRKCNQHCNADHTTIHPASDGENSDSFGGQRGQPQPQIDPARRQSLEASLHFDSIPQHSAVGCSFPRTRSSVSASAAAVAVQRSCDADRNNHMQQPRRRSSDDSSGTSRWTACNGEASHRHRFALGLEEARTDCDSTASVSSMSTDSVPLSASFWPPSSGRGRCRSGGFRLADCSSGGVGVVPGTSPPSLHDASPPSSRSSMEVHRDAQRRGSSEYRRLPSSTDDHPSRGSMSLNVESLQQQQAMARTPSSHHIGSHFSSRATNCSSDSGSLGFPKANPEVCGDSGAWGSLCKGSGAARAPPSPSDGFARAGPTTKEHPRPAGGAVPGAAILRRQGGGGGEGKWASLSDSQASVELFYRLRNCRQTVDFARGKCSAFARLDKAQLTIPQAMETLGTLREYEAVLLGGGAERACRLGLVAHAQQTAEACRLAHPASTWLQLAGLLHPLGKLLAHPSFGSEPQWSVSGEAFPVGCAFSPNIMAAEAFCNNPDRRRRIYTTPCGMYTPGCGLRNVVMTWSAPEYLHLVLAHNKGVRIPAPTLWLLRFAKFRSLGTGSYAHLLDDFDRSMLPWLREFQELSEFREMELLGRMVGAELEAHHRQLLGSHLPAGPLRW